MAPLSTRRASEQNVAHLLALLITFGLAGAVCRLPIESWPVGIFVFNLLEHLFGDLKMLLPPLLLLTFWLLLVGNEANRLVRAVLLSVDEQQDSQLRLFPLKTPAKEAARGRIIGILERLIIFIAVVMQQYTALGIVVAAKGIARYKKMENDPQFAEYFLIGTLLSVVVAAGIAMLAVPISPRLFAVTWPEFLSPATAKP
jgi:hypothetical protein